RLQSLAELVRQRLPRHRSGPDHLHDRELSQRARLEDDAQEPAHRQRIEARGLHRWLASMKRLLLVSGFWFLVFSCAEQRDHREQVEFWGLGREGEVVGALVPEFERRNPNIHIIVQQIPFIAAHEKLLTAYVGNATPDASQM